MKLIFNTSTPEGEQPVEFVGVEDKPQAAHGRGVVFNFRLLAPDYEGTRATTYAKVEPWAGTELVRMMAQLKGSAITKGELDPQDFVGVCGTAKVVLNEGGYLNVESFKRDVKQPENAAADDVPF